MKILVDIPKQDYIYAAKKHCLPSCDNKTLRKIYYETISSGIPLDEIKAEIRGKYRVILKDTPKDDWAVKWNQCIDEILQIINKYTQEKRNKMEKYSFLDKIEALVSSAWSLAISMYVIAEIWRIVEINIYGEIVQNQRDDVIYIAIGTVVFLLLWKHKTVRNSYILDLILLTVLVISNTLALENKCALVEFTALDTFSLCIFPLMEYAFAMHGGTK